MLPKRTLFHKVSERFRGVKGRPNSKDLHLQRSSNPLIRFAVSGLFSRGRQIKNGNFWRTLVFENNYLPKIVMKEEK